MKEKVYEAIRGWAGVSTWYTNHPLDKKRFHSAMTKLFEEVGGDVSDSDIRYALERYRNENIEMLGGKPSDEKVEEQVQKAMEVLGYLDDEG